MFNLLFLYLFKNKIFDTRLIIKRCVFFINCFVLKQINIVIHAELFLTQIDNEI